MNDDFYLGRFIGYTLYTVGVVISGIALLISGDFSKPWVLFALLIHVLFIAVLTIIRNKISKSAYCNIQSFLYLLLAFTMSHLFDSMNMLFIVVTLGSVASLLYIDLRIMKRYMLMSLLMFIAGLIIKLTNTLFHSTELSEYLISCFCVLGIEWICHLFAKIIAKRDKKSFEQERSLDDLLTVLSAKCEEAQNAAQSKSDFLSNMSHEIRTPLNSVLGMNELILRSTSDPEITEYALNVENSGKMLLALINDILDFSKIESGKMDILPVNYHLNSVINDVISMLNVKIEEKGLRLNLDVDPETPNSLRGDEVRVRQMLTNLLSNAVKYTEKGTITLGASFTRTDSDNIMLTLTVTDTGQGIKEEDLNKLFGSFNRVNEKKNRNIEGTGLGLAITSNLAKLMNGTITVNSVYCVGSSFRITIPQQVVKDDAVGDIAKTIITRKEEYKAYSASFIAPQVKLLVVDDNKSNLLVVQGLLKATQIYVETASSGIECLNKLRKTSYNIILLDHMMPDIATLNKIKEANLAPDVPIIALTANAVSGARDMYLEYGFDDYLSKPITGHDLEKMIMRYLSDDLITSGNETEPQKEVQETSVHTEPKTEEPADRKDGSDKMIDKELAMVYCGDSEELFEIVVQSYIEQSEEYLKKIPDAIARKDYDNYRIIVHAIKSTSLNIGAKSLSEEAKAQEFAVKEDHLEIVESGWEKLLENYKKVIEEASGYIK